MNYRFYSSVLTFLIVFSLSAPSAFAIRSVLPDARRDDGTRFTPEECIALIWNADNRSDENPDYGVMQKLQKGEEEAEQILGCAIISGKVKFYMFPFFLRWVLEFIIQLAGLIAVLMVLVGGYYYIAGGVTDDKEKGKTIITYALGGLALIMLSWFLVNLLLLALTT